MAKGYTKKEAQEIQRKINRILDNQDCPEQIKINKLVSLLGISEYAAEHIYHLHQGYPLGEQPDGTIVD